MAAAAWRAWLTGHFDGLTAAAGHAGYEDAIVGATPDGPWPIICCGAPTS
jgi:hypothetical protein